MATKKKGGAKKATKKAAGKKTTARKGSASKKTARRGAGSATKTRAKTKTKRTPNAAFMRPVQPDEALGAVVGNQPMPRTEVTKKLWAYIRKNGLQDQKERRMINADDKLARVFGGKKRVSMFDMTKLVSQHVS